MILAQPTMFDLLKLACNARPDEVEQYEAIIGKAWNVDEVANDHYNRGGIKFVLLDGDEPLAAAGFDMTTPGVWTAWMLGTMTAWERHWFAITWHTRKVMTELLDTGGARRLELSALASRTKACDWYVKGLRMELEGIKRGYGINGEDVATFARLRESAHG